MNIFPSALEIILAIFTTLLTLAVSLSLLKIQIANTKSVKSLEKEQKILIAKQSETSDLVRSKLITTQETQEVTDFLDKDAFKYINEVDEKLKTLESQKKESVIINIFRDSSYVILFRGKFFCVALYR